MARKALVVGATGIAGSATVSTLKQDGWEVVALARRPLELEGVSTVSVDLRDAQAVSVALNEVGPTHVFFTSWIRQETEAENIRVNGAIVRNVLDALRPMQSLRHFALVTGLKHYLGPFEAYGKGKLPRTPFREDQPRLDIDNFYYAQEDEVFRGRAGRFHVVRASAAHDHREGRRQRDEHGHDPGCVRQHLQGHGPAILFSWLAGAVERSHRHDRCPHPRAAPALGRHDACCNQ